MNSEDFEVWRGNSYRMAGWHFPFALDGSDIVLTIRWGGGEIIRSLVAGGLEIADAEIDGATVPVVYWTPTVAESRSIPAGRIARYEVERRVPDGEHRTYVQGYVVGVGGVNSD